MIDKELVLDNIEMMLTFGIDNLELDYYDVNYARNAFLDLFKFNVASATPLQDCEDIEQVISNLLQYAKEQNMECAQDDILFETRLFGIITPQPSAINTLFRAKIMESGSIQHATSWLFELSKANRYLRMKDINKNIMWEHDGSMGGIVVTINLSKPEKDPKQIAEALKAKSGYPACMLCTQNVGFAGHAGHPARQTLRMMPIEMGGEEWFIQFSPYQYYTEHLIALCGEHRPMKVDANCLQRLLDFVEQCPHYFMGSNAALPIVGGSILTHDHYQGGGKVLPMFNAPIRNSYKAPYKGVNISVVEWYNSVVRVEGNKKSAVHKAANDILSKWATYTDESVGILCKTDAQHNAVTPIARMENGRYVIDMILRNNRTDAQHPFGIYHPTEDLHNIKKEGIGIIEVMGIFILPGRLDNELKQIREYLTGHEEFSYQEVSVEGHPMRQHADMIKSLVEEFGSSNNSELADRITRGYINNACERILECTAVFKNTTVGQNAFDKFMTECLGCKKVKA